MGDDEVVDERLRRFRDTGDPGTLWPGLTEHARAAATRELERVTRAVLAGETHVDIDPRRVHQPYALAVAGHTSGVGPVVGWWLETGVAAATPDVIDAFGCHLHHARLRGARMEREVLPALDALIATGISPVVLKGFHTSRQYFAEPGMRRMSDLDLLVPADRVRDAESVLAHIGFRADGPSSRPYKRDWIGPSVDPRLFSIELADERSKWVVELHTSLDRVYHPGAVAKLDLLRYRTEPFVVAGRPLLALAPGPLIVTLACHCSQELDGVRLLRLLELIFVVRQSLAHATLNWDDVLAVLRECGAARFTYPAFALVNELAPGTVDDRVVTLGKRESTWAARHTVQRMIPAGGSLDERGMLRQVMWTRGLVAVSQRLLRNVWPAAFTRPGDVAPGWRVRIRRFRRGVLSLLAPDERQV